MELLHTMTQLACDKLLQYPWEDKVRYQDWLAQTYYYVRHSTRLLAAAASRFPFDETGEQFHVRFGKHIGEERSHEKLALHDLKVLGVQELPPELSVTRAFYATQYYKIDRQSPYALMGYILMLEATGPMCGGQILERVRQAHGDKCCSFLKLHTEEDVRHVEIALQQVASLNETEQSIVKQSLRQSTHAYCAILAHIQSSSDLVAYPGQSVST